MLDVQPKFTDDLAHRVLFFRRVFPADYCRARGATRRSVRSLRSGSTEQLERDEASASLRRSATMAPGDSRRARSIARADPAPTALAIDALVALGASTDDPAVARGVQALLAMQHPYGLWNRSAKTGFVTTSYVLHTLSRLYPDEQPKLTRKDFEPTAGESLHDTIARMRLLAQLDPWSAAATEEPPKQLLDLMQAGAAHSQPEVRYWAMIALGARHIRSGGAGPDRGPGRSGENGPRSGPLGTAANAARRSGWEQVFAAYEQRQRPGARTARRGARHAGRRGDAALASRSSSGLAAMLDRMMSRDANPAVRAWAARAAWNWWLWNPPTRQRLNQAYLTMLQTPEPSQSGRKRQALSASGAVDRQRQSRQRQLRQPYPELADLFQAIGKRMLAASMGRQMSERLTGVAATYYNASYGSNGTGQLGYATPHAAETIGKAVLGYWEEAEARDDSSESNSPSKRPPT